MNETNLRSRGARQPRTYVTPRPKARRSATPEHKRLDRDERMELLGLTLLQLSAAQGVRASCAELAHCVRQPGHPRKRARPASRRELERLLHRQRRLMARAHDMGSASREARHLPA